MSKSWFGSNLENFDSAESDFKRLVNTAYSLFNSIITVLRLLWLAIIRHRQHQLMLFFGAPRQAWLVCDRETKVRRELLHLVDTQGFREDVYHLKVRAHVL